MLSGEGNENRKKKKTTTTIGLISNTLFSTFLCRCFARLLRETSRKFLVTRSHGGNVGRVLVHFFFSTVAPFHPGGQGG